MREWIKFAKLYIWRTLLAFINPSAFAQTIITKTPLKSFFIYLIWLIAFVHIVTFTLNSLINVSDIQDDLTESMCSQILASAPESVKQTVLNYKPAKHTNPKFGGFKIIGPMISKIKDNGTIDFNAERVIEFGFSGLAFPQFCFLEQHQPQNAMIKFGIVSILFTDVIPNKLDTPLLTLLILLAMALTFTPALYFYLSQLSAYVDPFNLFKAVSFIFTLMYVGTSLSFFAYEMSYGGIGYLGFDEFIVERLIITAILMIISITILLIYFVIIIKSLNSKGYSRTILSIALASLTAGLTAPFILMPLMFLTFYFSNAISFWHG
jgi:hypothetical protein